MDLDALAQEAIASFAAEGHELVPEIVAGRDVRPRSRLRLRPRQTSCSRPAGTDDLDGGRNCLRGRQAACGAAGGNKESVCALAWSAARSQAAMGAIARGEVEQIDIATANGRPSSNQFGVGTHARLVRIRDQIELHSRFGKMMASLRAVSAAAINPPRFDVRIDRGEDEARQTVSGVVVSNNRLDNAPVPIAERLDAGQSG